MDTLVPDTLAPAPPVERRPRISLWMLRLATAVNVLAVLAQPVLAGFYLTGDVDAIDVHGLIGTLLAVVALVMVAVALAYVLAGRGRLWVLPVAVLQFLAVGFQIAAGYARELELHVPLGVAICVMSVLLAAWVWTPAAGRPRGRR